MSAGYQAFLAEKERTHETVGIHNIVFMPDILFDFQRDLTEWSLKKGKAAIWAGCGLGKTFMLLTWAVNVLRSSGSPVLILAPLAVSRQTVEEGKKIGLDVNIAESQSSIKNAINITNYEKLHKFDASVFSGIVLDESSILKNFSGKIRNNIINSFADTQFKLCCSATPSPNDFTEIGNHAEFLNVCSRTEMLATYFIHDSGATQKWRLKGHAEKPFFRWLSNWAVMIEKPSDIGYDDDIMRLPELNMTEHKVSSKPNAGELFVTHAATLNDRRKARRKSLEKRCELAADIVNRSDESFLIWCDLNDESAMISRMIPGAYEVKGADDNQKKITGMVGFATGDIRVLVTKPKIAQFGMNWQICHNMIFVGLSDSFEAFYQALRRCYRFGQKHPVNVHIVISEEEGSVLENIRKKEVNAKYMLERMVKFISMNTVEHGINKKRHYKNETGLIFKRPTFLED